MIDSDHSIYRYITQHKHIYLFYIMRVNTGGGKFENVVELKGGSGHSIHQLSRCYSFYQGFLGNLKMFISL